ncbi:MAG TPA: hypothetical protein DCQ98_09200 [Planctomycetaceae bacterium]|nr:hypothetical protein [Planctomycetaceae bacterium]
MFQDLGQEDEYRNTRFRASRSDRPIARLPTPKTASVGRVTSSRAPWRLLRVDPKPAEYTETGADEQEAIFSPLR